LPVEGYFKDIYGHTAVPATVQSYNMQLRYVSKGDEIMKSILLNDSVFKWIKK
jgi:hypothetical protein